MRIVADENIREVNAGRMAMPPGWHSRCLYIGEQGANNWLDIVHQQTYPLHGEDPYGLNANRLAAIEAVPVKTMVSLGPGEALHDIPLVGKLRSAEPNLLYIPVDISDPLLHLAIDNMREHVRISAGLLCDYEQWGSIVVDALAEFAERPILFALLGGGFGNLDQGELHFLNKMKQLMNTNDRLLLDVPLAGPAWTADDDPRLRKSEYSAEFKKFLTRGLADSQSAGDDSLLDQLDRRIDCDVSEEGDVTGTRAIVIRDRSTDRELLHFCRYNWESLIDWLGDAGFDVLFQRSSIRSDADKFGMGVVLAASREG